MKTAFINANIVLKNEIIENGALLVEDGVITRVGKDFPIARDFAYVDVEGKYLAPGFIDIHTHASDRKFFMEAPEECAKYHLEHGTTSVYPALYFSMNTEQYVAAIKQMKEAKNNTVNIEGVYLEGPYLNPKFGCDKEHCPWKDKADPEKFMPIVDEAKDFAVVYCVAPEREGILDYVKAVREANPNAVFSVAHSEAAPEQCEALIPYGLKIGTHFTDATGKVHRWPDVEIVGVGPDEVVLLHDEMYAELIVDEFGIHVDPYMLKLARKVKGDDKLILISDAYAADGPVPEGYDGVTDINFDWTGEIAGSKINLASAVRNMMKHTGAGIVEAVRMATANPATAIGVTDRGEIKEGMKADLIIIDDKINVSAVFKNGEQVI
ncbi:MAG: amidohydrolase family protein [Eubacteriales bacterium]|nr:amidohydrolase family protein [Eubacteriales bacterium]